MQVKATGMGSEAESHLDSLHAMAGQQVDRSVAMNCSHMEQLAHVLESMGLLQTHKFVKTVMTVLCVAAIEAIQSQKPINCLVLQGLQKCNSIKRPRLADLEAILTCLYMQSDIAQSTVITCKHGPDTNAKQLKGAVGALCNLQHKALVGNTSKVENRPPRPTRGLATARHSGKLTRSHKRRAMAWFGPKRAHGAAARLAQGQRWSVELGPDCLNMARR